MKRIIRLTEQDLARIVRRVLNEDPELDPVKYLQTKLGWKIDDSMKDYNKIFIHNAKNGGVDKATKYITIIRPKSGDSTYEAKNSKSTKTWKNLFNKNEFDKVYDFVIL